MTGIQRPRKPSSSTSTHDDVGPLRAHVEPGFDVKPYRTALRSQAKLEALRDETAKAAKGGKQAAKQAEKEAAAIVEKWAPADWERSLFRPTEKDKAVDFVAQGLFSRTAARQQKADAAAAKLLAKAADGALSVDERAASVMSAIELRSAAAYNATASLAANLPGLLRTYPLKITPNRVAAFFKGGPPTKPPTDLTRAARPGEDASAIDPVPSSFWKRRDPADCSPANLYRGPWFAEGERPALPAAPNRRVGEAPVMELDGFRSADGSGSHPSVDVVMPRAARADGPRSGQKPTVYKVKFYAPQQIAEEPITVRILHACGWNTLPKYSIPGRQLDLDVRAVIAADITRPVTKPLGIPLFNGFRPAAFVEQVTMKDGTVLDAPAAAQKVYAAERSPAVRDTIDRVTVSSFDVTVKTKQNDAIGPWNSDALSHDDRRSVRALALVSSWLAMKDFKTMNYRLDLKEPAEEGGVPELVHVLSDTGYAMEPQRLQSLSRTVGIDTKGAWLHDNQNMVRLRAFDKMTYDDARWGLRQIASLTEDQLLGCFAASESPAAVVLFAFERFLARRDDLLEKLDLVAVDGLHKLRPNGAKHLEVRDEPLEIVLAGGNGEPPATVTLPGSGYEIRNGSLFQNGAKVRSHRPAKDFVCFSADPHDDGPLEGPRAVAALQSTRTDARAA